MQITVWQDGRSYICTAATGERLTDVLRRAGLYLPTPCGGNGRCGNCRVRFTQRPPVPSSSDLQKLTPEQIEAGWRLACTACVQNDCTLTLDKDERFAVEAPVSGGSVTGRAGIAIDIGTTTIAAALVGLPAGNVVAVRTGVNHQRAFGADVLSRIRAAADGHAGELRDAVTRDVDTLIASLLEAGGVTAAQVENVVIAANTTMLHLLGGWDTGGLGAAPFTPAVIEPKSTPYFELTGTRTLTCPVSFLPCASAFIGGDVVAGLIACGLDRGVQPRLLLDVGTNGELVLAIGGRYIATSVAAGPAFEGGRLSCGIGSIPGAICRVRLRKPNVLYETIGNEPPVGLCGTGAIEALCELREAGLVDKTGRLSPLFPEGFPLTDTVMLTQGDIRELQMAKAAVYAGVTLLLRREGLSPADVSQAYLAGGFGTKLDVRTAQTIGMLPRGLRTEAAGNTALDGAIYCLLHEDGLTRARALARQIEDHPLADDPAFASAYLQAMEL